MDLAEQCLKCLALLSERVPGPILAAGGLNAVRPVAVRPAVPAPAVTRKVPAPYGRADPSVSRVLSSRRATAHCIDRRIIVPQGALASRGCSARLLRTLTDRALRSCRSASFNRTLSRLWSMPASTCALC